ncbi:hypothetical protein [Aquabacter spiritensis]|uniref:Uncharacterized protein n=1 Tax=Aquabacter spiritensis TaxID=933073 RepID=A0A4R3M1Y6_9HYPH|nr:hypothetical protein [Aquabacter spiritensis]TCT06696.1 hypothetical protein EDC64_102175 [Aquabacter spiritensis]
MRHSLFVFALAAVGTLAAPSFSSAAEQILAGAANSPKLDFAAISNADLGRWQSSGCSFALFRNKDLVAIFDTQDARKKALFKIDGRITAATATAGDPSAYWVGTVGGRQIRMIKGRVNPAVRNDGGGQGGEGRLEWSGPSGHGAMTVRWEEGC